MLKHGRIKACGIHPCGQKKGTFVYNNGKIAINFLFSKRVVNRHE